MEDRAHLSAAEKDAYYEQLVSMYSPALHAFILRRIRSPQDAEDIVQESFLHAYYALERYSLQQVRTLQARPWLYKITWNVYRNYTSRSKPPFAVSLDTPAADFLLDLDDEEQQRPEALYERGERRREVEALVDTLPEPYHEVIGLYYFDDLNHQEIAELLNRPVGTIKTQVHRGLRLLRKAMQVKEGRTIR